jgi:hypothetical protein
MRKIYLLLFVVLLAMPASATVRYVDASRPDNAGDGLTWAAAHKYLQTALAAAVDGDQIWVAQGTYKPTTSTTDRNATFVMKEGVAIYGGFTSGQMNLNDRNTDPATNGTVLSSDIDGDGTARNNSFHIVYNDSNALTLRAVLDGFTIRGGNTYQYPSSPLSEGSAIYNNSSSPLIANCLFSFNASSGAPGAIYSKNSSLHLSKCTFQNNASGNTQGGAIGHDGGSPKITDCNFKGNIASSFDGGAISFLNTGPQTEISNSTFEGNASFYAGGAIFKEGGSLLLKNCLFQSNTNIFNRTLISGGAINNSGSLRIESCQFINNNTQGPGGAIASGEIEIKNSKFTGNSGSVGGALAIGANSQVTNCLFQNNSAGFGGAVSGGNNSQFINCSFLENSASGIASIPDPQPQKGGAALYSAGRGSIQLTNCIFWNNRGSDTFNHQSADSPFVASYSLLDASATNYVNGGNNIVMNIVTLPSPFISDSDARLRPGSLAIDAGLNSANSTTTDLGGNDRIVNGTIDMGAYEFGSNSGSLVITGVSGVNCQELSETARQLTFTPTYSGTDGSPITFSVYGELAETTTPGPYSLRLYKDNPSIILNAKQSNGDQSSYRYDWLAVCGTPPPPPPPTGAFAITGVSGVECQTLSSTARQLTFTPTYSGTDGSPITFSVYGELAETTAPGPYSLRLYKDNPVITLTANQGTGSQFSFRYDWLAACNASAVRLAAYAEPGAELQVKILGNPVNDGMVKLEVRGAQGQPLALQLMDKNGRLITEHQVEQAGVVENHSLELGQQATGLLLLRVNTPSQNQTVKILHVR